MEQTYREFVFVRTDCSIRVFCIICLSMLPVTVERGSCAHARHKISNLGIPIGPHCTRCGAPIDNWSFHDNNDMLPCHHHLCPSCHLSWWHLCQGESHLMHCTIPQDPHATSVGEAPTIFIGPNFSLQLQTLPSTQMKLSEAMVLKNKVNSKYPHSIEEGVGFPVAVD